MTVGRVEGGISRQTVPSISVGLITAVAIPKGGLMTDEVAPGEELTTAAATPRGGNVMLGLTGGFSAVLRSLPGQLQIRRSTTARPSTLPLKSK